MAKKTRRISKKDKYMRGIRIEELMFLGHTKEEVVRVVAAEFGVAETTVVAHMNRVIDQWGKQRREKIPASRHKYLSRLEMMFRDAWAKGNMKVALDVQKEINRLAGLYDEEKKDVAKIEAIVIREESQKDVIGQDD